MRKPIEAWQTGGPFALKVCNESEVRELESDYAKLEARLGEAVEALRDILDSGFHLTKIECWEIADNFLNKLDKDGCDEV